jgi:hypothetical protein
MDSNRDKVSPNGGPGPNAGPVGGTPDGMTALDVERRSELATYIGKDVYPVSTDQLIDLLIERKAPNRVVDALRTLPTGRPFANLQEVWASLGGGVEQHRS